MTETQSSHLPSHPVWRYLEDEIDILLQHIQPVSPANTIRGKITSFLAQLLQEKMKEVKLGLTQYYKKFQSRICIYAGIDKSDKLKLVM